VSLDSPMRDCVNDTAVWVPFTSGEVDDSVIDQLLLSKARWWSAYLYPFDVTD
jgi:hypothetical protein